MLAGCAASGNSILQPQANIPAVPADVETCQDRELSNPPERKLTEGETERYWSNDRYEFTVVRGCLRRLVCQNNETRKLIGGVEDLPPCRFVNESVKKPVIETWRKKK